MVLRQSIAFSLILVPRPRYLSGSGDSEVNSVRLRRTEFKTAQILHPAFLIIIYIPILLTESKEVICLSG